jgi:hypothetical protein
MGAKTWMIAYVDGDASAVLKSNPHLDREASLALAGRLFPGENLEALPDGDLCFTCPGDDELLVGCFPGLSIVAAKEFLIDYPSKLAPAFLKEADGRKVYFHAMHSVVDWFAFAIWENGTLRRSLSLAPDNGVMEDIGPKMPFEEPYWAGGHPAIDPEDDEDEYAFVFHPLELGEAALAALFGYQLEGYIDESMVQPETIAMLRFRRMPSRPWWKLWK